VQASFAERARSLLSIRPQAVLAALAACVFVVLLFVGNGSPERPQPSGSSSSNASTAPKLTSADGLRRLSAAAAQPVYWIGEQPRTKLELTRTATGRIFVRYLPVSAQIADPSLAYPFVATYRYPRALDAVRKAAGADGSLVRTLSGGGLAVQNRRGPELVKATRLPLPSPPVFLAYPGSDFLVEVYDRSTDRALELVSSGRVRPVR
jgi:hypothetical protein